MESSVKSKEIKMVIKEPEAKKEIKDAHYGIITISTLVGLVIGAALTIVIIWGLNIDILKIINPPQKMDPSTTDTIIPTVSITSPTNGSSINTSTSTTITADVSDNVGIASVVFYVADTIVCTDSTAPYSCAWTTPTIAGTKTISVTATDTSGNKASKTAAITVKTPDPIVTQFTGKYITAQVPQSWVVKEYINGQEPNSFVGKTAVGLTGITISHNSNIVFTVRAIDGIGSDGCPTYPIFEDNNSAYQQQYASDCSSLGGTFSTKNYSGTTYSEFKWFGTTFRRIIDAYYYDTKAGDNFFQPSRDLTFIDLTGLTFNFGSSQTASSTYDFRTATTATSIELSALDTILESMKVK